MHTASPYVMGTQHIYVYMFILLLCVSNSCMLTQLKGTSGSDRAKDWRGEYCTLRDTSLYGNTAHYVCVATHTALADQEPDQLDSIGSRFIKAFLYHALQPIHPHKGVLI